MYTIKDISKITGLSISIISRYLNGHNVRKENKILIDEAVRKTGYTPNEFARSLRAEQTKCIGAVVPSLADNFALSILHYAETYFKNNGYTLFLSDYHNSEKDEIDCVKTMIQKRVDALIVLPISDCKEISELAKNSKIPVIIFDQYFPNVTADYVLFKNKEASKNACDILIEKGHKNIAVITGPLSDYTPKERLEGYKSSLEENGIELDNALIVESKEYFMDSSYKTAKNFLQNNKKTTAIFSTSFDITLGVIKALNELNLKIPDDISIMAFDSLPIYEALKPKLWTIIQPVEKIAEMVAKRVLERINEGDNLQYSTIYIDYDIREGNSIKTI